MNYMLTSILTSIVAILFIGAGFVVFTILLSAAYRDIHPDDGDL